MSTTLTVVTVVTIVLFSILVVVVIVPLPVSLTFMFVYSSCWVKGVTFKELAIKGLAIKGLTIKGLTIKGLIVLCLCSAALSLGGNGSNSLAHGPNSFWHSSKCCLVVKGSVSWNYVSVVLALYQYVVMEIVCCHFFEFLFGSFFELTVLYGSPLLEYEPMTSIQLNVSQTATFIGPDSCHHNCCIVLHENFLCAAAATFCVL